MKKPEKWNKICTLISNEFQLWKEFFTYCQKGYDLVGFSLAKDDNLITTHW